MQEGGKENPRFMEIEGVVRDIVGDNGAIIIKQKENLAREKGDVDMSTEIQIRDNVQGNKDNETVMSDPKRRRLDEEISGENNGLNNMYDKEDFSVTGSKNL